MVPIWDAIFVIGVNALIALLILGAIAAWREVKRRKDTQTITSLVRAAEQMLSGRSGEEKLMWVLSQARKHVPSIRPDLVRVLVEEAVHEMNRSDK